MSDDTGRARTTVKRYDWERHLKAADAEPLTKLVGLVLGTYTSGSTGTNAHPGIENLRRDCGVGNERTIRRHLAKLVEMGLIERVFHASRAGRGGLADVYELRVPSATSGLTSPDQWTPESNPVDSGTQPSVPSTSPEAHHSSRLALAHDKSRADEDKDEDDLAEDIRQGLEAWSLKHHGVYLDMADERYIVAMVSRGVPRRVIENTIKKRIREAEEDWRALIPGDLPEASGAPF